MVATTASQRAGKWAERLVLPTAGTMVESSVARWAAATVRTSAALRVVQRVDQSVGSMAVHLVDLLGV